jgi:hypothetical protein
MHLPALAQIGGDYNPNNPGDPGNPVLQYTLTLKAIPTDGGYFSVTSTRVYVNEQYNIRAYPNSDYAFVAWICDGDTISKSASYNITMPAHDVEITGVFKYNPSSPGDPQEQALKYQLSLRAEPVNSGSFNIYNERIAAGSVNTLRAYTNTDFVFKHWRIGDTILSTNQNMDFTMPAHNVEIIGQFEYNPANPGNPNANYWNPLTGEVIVDDFTPGYMSNAISTLLNSHGASWNDVQMIIVAGRMTNNDFGVVNNCSNCALLDLSRVTGITEVPSYAFDYTNLESVYLPATIETIGYRAFYQCTKLSSLTIYAMTPPQLGGNVFDGVPDGLVVYVPAAAIAQYQDDPNWGKYIILPIQEDIRTLTVNLPTGANPADYAHMWLELTNTQNGQRMHYVMDERTSYKFNNIIRNTTWDVVLRNPNGDIFGRIDNVEVGDEDVTVTFASLSKPYNVTLSVLTPSGQDVTSQAEITWTDAGGNYISQEPTVTGLPIGYQLVYTVKLQQELAMAYNAPVETYYTVKNGNNAIVCHLTAISKVTVSGKVKDAKSGLPLNGANITASQTFGGKYDQTISTKSDGSGAFSFEICQVPTVIGAAASDYISKTVDCDIMAGTGEIILPNVALDPITGATIAVDFTFTPCHTTDAEAETQDWYSDYNNVDYTIFNKTENRSIGQFSAQYPQIVLLEDVLDGNVLELTATSRKDAFKPVKTTVTIAEQKANATFNIIELGKIAASFKKNSNPIVVGTLYDGNGKLVDTYNYNDAALEISDLVDGNYTLVTMGGSQFFNTIYDIAQLPQTGLVSGVDYMRSNVEVKSGLISSIVIENVPLLDESKLYYTGENTSFTVNKPSIVIGNYLTMTGHLDFKPVYAGQVSNVSMIVDLPESCSFVENSVMVGNSTSSYTINGNQITIPMARYTDRVRFCVIPTVGGEYAPSAFAQFDINGKTIKQPIGAANYIAHELSINVPSTVAKTSVPVSGTAIGQCNVDIYDNGVLIGQTTSLANGTWSMTCELNEPYNLSTHGIYAKIITKAGLELNTEMKLCTFDKYAIEVSTVTMINTAHPSGSLDLCEYKTVFNFITPPSSFDPYWYWPSYPDFTFLVDFTNNDTTLISDVILYVFTDNNKVVTLYPKYDPLKDTYVVTEKFYSNALPKNVSVDFTCETKRLLDIQQIYDSRNECEKISADYYDAMNRLNDLLAQYPDSISDDDFRYICEILEIEYTDVADIEIDELDFTDWSQNEIDAYLDSCYAECESELGLIESFLGGTDQWFEIPKEYSGIFGDGAYSLSDCSGLTPELLISQGFNEIETTTGTFVYLFSTENEVTFVDFEQNIRISIVLSDSSSRLFKVYLSESEGNFSYVYDKISKARELVNNIYGDFMVRLMLPEKKLQEIIKSLEIYLANCKNWKSKCKDPAKIAKWEKTIARVERTIASTRTALKYTSKFLRFLARCVPIADYLATISNCYDVASTVHGIYNSIPDPCPDDQSKANWCKVEAWSIALSVAGLAMYDVVAEITGDVEIAGGAAAAIATEGASLAVTGWGIVQKVAAQIGKYAISFFAQNVAIKHLRKTVNELECFHEDPPENDDDPDRPDPTNPDVPHVMDPSGFVYEGVPSNRLQGVTTTCFYKETVEDMYGDVHDEVVLWDASQYGQENPLFTDEYGYYGWDVPIGLWQVKYEKAGYETVFSEWLPVPPPQLDINVAMTQMRQPEVLKARAYTKAVEFEFDKYMKPETLTTENISVTVNGTAVDGNVVLLNEEIATEGGETFASRVRFNASAPFNADEVTLHVCHKVESYAGLRMSDDYEQTLTVEYEIEKIDVDTTVYVIYGDKRQLTVTVEPVQASKGKKLTVRTSSPMIVTIDSESYTLDNNGQAVVTVNGDLPGMGSLLYGIDGYDLSATTLVNVMMENQMNVATPTASVASGSEVPKGTAVYLRCATEGATIYYTLDGSCPCDDTPARNVYDGTPIIINGDITIKAMATAPDLYDSDVATFVYRVSAEINGDVNRDGEVNIADINVIITVILSSDVNPDVLARADVNGDGEVNIADINVIIKIILSAKSLMAHEVNCDDKVHLDNVTLKPGEVRTMQVTLDNASHYSAMQCDIVLPAGLTLIGTNAIGSNVSKIGSIDEMSSRALTYSTNKTPFVNNGQGVLALTVRADAALSSESEITLTNVVLADLEDKAWHIADCSARVNNSSGINDLTAIADRVWVDGHTLFIETRQDGIAQLATINGVVRDISLKHGINQLQLEWGIYIVVINGNSHKIAIK